MLTKLKKFILDHHRKYNQDDQNPPSLQIQTLFALESGIRTALLCGALKLSVGQLLSFVKKRRLIGFNRSQLQDTAQLSLFLGTFSFSSKMIHALLNHHHHGERTHHAFVAGLLGGVFGMLWDKDVERRKSIAVYMFVQAACMILSDLVQRDVIPKFKHADVLLFCTAIAPIMHAYVADPDALPKSYGRFIVNIGPIDQHALDVARDLIYDKPYSQIAMRKLSDKFGVCMPSTPLKRVDCTLFHPGQHSCSRVVLKVFIQSLLRSYVYYFPLLIPKLVRALINKNRKDLVKWFIQLSRMSAFLSTFIGSYQFWSCLEANLRPTQSSGYFTYGVVGFLAAMSLIIAPKYQRYDIATWIAPRGLQTLWHFWKKQGGWPGFVKGEIALFAVSAATLYTYWHHQPSLLPKMFQSVMSFLITK